MPQAKISKKKQIIYIAIIAVMLISSFVMLKNFLQEPQDSKVLDQQAIIQNEARQGSSMTELESQAILNKILQDLKKVGNWSVVLGYLGRSNPFMQP